jgi:hypothetical protein
MSRIADFMEAVRPIQSHLKKMISAKNKKAKNVEDLVYHNR